MSSSAKPSSNYLTDQITHIADHIVKLKRQERKADPQQDITEEERKAVIVDALDMYKLLSEKSAHTNGKILVEYKKGLRKIIEEVVLP